MPRGQSSQRACDGNVDILSFILVHVTLYVACDVRKKQVSIMQLGLMWSVTTCNS